MRPSRGTQSKAKADEIFGWLTLSDHNSDLQVFAPHHSVLERKLATLQVVNFVSRQLPLPLLLPIRVFQAVILWINEASGLIVLDVRDDIAPSLVIVDAQSEDTALAFVSQKAKSTGRSTATHLEHVESVDVAPCSTVSVIPNRLLDNAEVLGISLEDHYFDRITHFCDW